MAHHLECSCESCAGRQPARVSLEGHYLPADYVEAAPDCVARCGGCQSVGVALHRVMRWRWDLLSRRVVPECIALRCAACVAQDPRCQPDRPRTGEELTRPRCEALVQRADGRLQVQRRCSLGLGESVHELGAPVCADPQTVPGRSPYQWSYKPTTPGEMLQRIRAQIATLPECDACGDDPSEWPCVVCHQGGHGHEVYKPDPDADREADRVMLGDGMDLPGRCPNCREVMMRARVTHVVSVPGGWRDVGSGWASVCLACAGAL